MESLSEKSNNLRYQRASPYASGDLVITCLLPERVARHGTGKFFETSRFSRCSAQWGDVLRKLLFPVNGRVVVRKYYCEPPLWTSQVQAVSWLERNVWSVLRLVDEAPKRAKVDQASAERQ